jgi:hypothetical protein
MKLSRIQEREALQEKKREKRLANVEDLLLLF